LDKNVLWFGAGYKLYRVDLNQPVARVVHDTKDVVISFVQVDDEKLYFGGINPLEGESTIWSLGLSNGSVEWKKEFKYDWFGGGYITTRSLVANDLLIVGTRTNLYGFNKTNGNVQWKIKGDWLEDGEFLTSILSNERLFYGVDAIPGNDPDADRRIAIADVSSGKTLKTISIPGMAASIPSVQGNHLFVKDYQSYRRDTTGKLHWIGELRLNCIDLDSGSILWTFQGYGVPQKSQMAFYDGLVLDVFANRLYAINEQSGTPKWQSPELEAAGRNPQVIEESRIIALEIPSSEKVVFLDFATGQLQDKELLNTLSSPIFIGQEAIYGTTNALVKVNIITGDIIWSIPVDSKYQEPIDD